MSLDENNDMKIQVFTFNPIQENTYVLYDETGECVIIDAGCLFPPEENALKSFVDDNGLKIKRLINTHSHFDHIFGNAFIKRTYGLSPEGHKADKIFVEAIKETVRSYGFTFEVTPEPIGNYLDEGDIVTFGNVNLELLHIPGHSPGSLCFYNKQENILFSGDVLFKESIGRSDFKEGDFGTLIEGITNKLLVLPDETIVYPGHGEVTTIGYEKIHNPYL